MEKRVGKVNSVAVLTNPRTKEVKYIPATDIVLKENYNLQNLLEDIDLIKGEIKVVKANFNKLVDFIKEEKQEVLK